MKRVALLLLCLFTAVAAHGGEARKFRLTLQFTDPAFRWSRTVTYREEFHLLLDNAPLGDEYWGWVAGVIYPKNGESYISLKMSKLHGKSDTDGAHLGGIAHVRLPKDGSVDIPMVSGDFQSCKATWSEVKKGK